MFGNEPHHGIVDGRVFVRKLVAEIDDPPGLSDLGDDLRCYARENRYRLADNGELALHSRAYKPVRTVGSEVKPERALSIAAQASTMSFR